MLISFNDIESIKKAGFTGFIPLRTLFQDYSIIPKVKGVYLVLCTNNSIPEFLSIGTGGHFKGRNPNVSIDMLKSNWVENTIVINIGKAGGSDSKASLQSRLKQYLRFGQGEPVGHWGGRYIWQIKDSANLILCWKTLPSDEPRLVEKDLIMQFKFTYGKRPFANLQD